MTPQNESIHFTNCNVCGEPFDMRDLGQVFAHEHEGDLAGKPEPTFSSSRRRGDPTLWKEGKEPITLN